MQLVALDNTTREVILFVYYRYNYTKGDYIMLICKRKPCTAGTVTTFDMQLSALKWKIKNFTDGEIYVSAGTWDPENNVRIEAGTYEIMIDRVPQTGTRKTSRVLYVSAAADGEVEVMMM